MCLSVLSLANLHLPVYGSALETWTQWHEGAPAELLMRTGRHGVTLVVTAKSLRSSLTS